MDIIKYEMNRRKYRKNIKKRHYRVRGKIKQYKIKKITKILTFIILIIVIPVSMYVFYCYISNSELFKIKKIYVKGLSTIPIQEFNQKISCKTSNIISTYFTDLKTYIKNVFPQIKTVKIEYKIPETIKFHIIERTPIAYIKIYNKDYFVDEQNKIFKLNTSSITVPELILNKDIERKNAVDFLNLLSKKSFVFYKKIKKIYFQENDIVSILDSNIQLLWGQVNKDNIDKKIKFLNLVIEDKNYKPLEYIDLRFSSYEKIIAK